MTLNPVSRFVESSKLDLFQIILTTFNNDDARTFNDKRMILSEVVEFVVLNLRRIYFHDAQVLKCKLISLKLLMLLQRDA